MGRAALLERNLELASVAVDQLGSSCEGPENVARTIYLSSRTCVQPYGVLPRIGPLPGQYSYHSSPWIGCSEEPL